VTLLGRKPLGGRGGGSEERGMSCFVISGEEMRGRGYPWYFKPGLVWLAGVFITLIDLSIPFKLLDSYAPVYDNFHYLCTSHIIHVMLEAHNETRSIT